MAVFGIDLGVRSWHATGLLGSQLWLAESVLKVKGKVADQGEYERGDELFALALALRRVVSCGDTVFIEEPPAAGSKNLRVFMKLAQVSGIVGYAARSVGAMVIYVPVNTWKKELCGKGGISKEAVAQWLEKNHESYSVACHGDQDSIDATCIALYGNAHLGGDDPPQRTLLAAS